MYPRGAFDFLKEVLSEWSRHRATTLAAALSYYTVFSLAPLLVIAIAIAGLAFGQDAARGQIEDQIAGVVGPDAAGAVQTMLSSASQPRAGIIASVVGAALLVLGATGIFGQLQQSLNTIWDTQPPKGGGIIGMAKKRLLSFGMVLVVGVLLLVSLVASAAIAALASGIANLLPGTVLVLQGVNLILSVVVITLLFAMTYKYLPDIRIGWRDVWVGALITALLFVVGRLGLEVYLSRSNPGSAYGAAGSLVVLLVWVYYAAQILFLGAEFTQVYARRYGTRIEPGLPGGIASTRPTEEGAEEERRAA